MAVTKANRLGCGRDIDEVWDKADLPPDEHEQSCPDCQAARASLAGLAAVAQEMVRTDRDDPTLQVDTDVFDRIVEVARAEVRRGRRLPLREPEPGQLVEDLTVSEQAVATIVREIGDRMSGIETRRCSVELVPPARLDETGLRPATYLITLRVSASATVPIVDLIETLRSRVIDAVTSSIGVNVAAVDVFVEDLHDA